jgi:outer membrane receptor protein involved in Fe transport
MMLIHMLAQAAAAAMPQTAAAPPPAQQGVISYPASFFAAQQVANASEMVARVPGFSLDTGDAVRGFEGAAGNVLIDGQRPTSKTDDLDEILRRVPASQVERIDIIRGGAPGIDMQGKSVLANVVRKPGGGFRGLLAVANNHLYDGRNMHGMRLELSGGAGLRTWEASARYGYGNDDGGDHGPQVRVGPNGEILRTSLVTGQSDGVQQTITGAYEQPLAGGKIRVNGRIFWEHWKFEQDNLFSSPAELGTQTTDDTYLTRQTELGGRYNRDFGAKTSVELIALRQTRDRDISSAFSGQGDTTAFRLLREGSETIGRGVAKYRFSEQLSFEAGGEGAFNALDSETRLTFNGAPVDVPAANVRVEERRGEAFVKAVWRPTPAWTLDGGLRYEASDISSDGDLMLEKSLKFAKPRLAVTWAPMSATQVRLRFERVVGQLNFDDFVASADFDTGAGVSAGNPDLDPEQAWVSEASLEQRFWGGAVGVLTLRHSALKDVVDRGPVFVDGGVFDQPTNIGDGTKDELIANLTVPFDRLGLKGALLKGEGTWRRSEVTDPTTGAKREISALRPLEWSVNYSQDLPQWQMSYGFDIYGGWTETYYRFDSIETVKLHNAYVRPWIERRLMPDLVLRVEIGNLTERGIRSNRKVYGVPRTAANLQYADDRDLTFGRTFYVRVRKTFGS